MSKEAVAKGSGGAGSFSKDARSASMSRPGSRVGITGATYAATGGRGREAGWVGELALAKARTRAPGDEPPKTSEGLLVTIVSTGTERAEGGAGEKAFARSVSGDDFCSVPKGD
jgi:hypothetical protein